MPDLLRFLSFEEAAQQANWALNITPIVTAPLHSPPIVSPTVSASRQITHHSSTSSPPHDQPSTGGLIPRGTPDLHSAVEQSINRHNQLHRTPCVVSQPGGREELDLLILNSSLQI